MGKSKRQVLDKEEQEASEWWGRARYRRVMGENKRQADDREEH
jgi:hypothetical protein